MILFEQLLLLSFLLKNKFNENSKNFKHIIVFSIYSFTDKETGTDILSHDTHFYYFSVADRFFL